MALSIPALEDIIPFDANDTYDFKFRYDKGGNQYTQSNLVIETNRGDGTDSEIYNQIMYSFDPFHTYVPSSAISALINGKQYKAKIRVGTEEEWSDFSEWKLFYVHTMPVVEITTIDDSGFIYNHIETFQANYIIPSEEGDPLMSYSFILYDENMGEIEKFPKKYAGGGNIEQTVKNLEANVKYIIYLETESTHGVVTKLFKEFIPLYDFPILGDTKFIVTNLRDKPSVKVEFELYQISGKVVDGGFLDFEDNTWVDLKNRSLQYDKDFCIDKDFVLKLWCKDLDDNSTILKMSNDNGRIEIAYLGGYIHIFKCSSAYCNHIVCPEAINSTKDIYIFLAQEKDKLNLICHQD